MLELEQDSFKVYDLPVFDLHFLFSQQFDLVLYRLAFRFSCKTADCSIRLHYSMARYSGRVRILATCVSNCLIRFGVQFLCDEGVSGDFSFWDRCH